MKRPVRDVMPHRLIELAGAAVRMRTDTTMSMMGGYSPGTPGLMNWMGASTTVTFSRSGVYRFRTRAGEDFMPGIQTSGADNVLTLTIKVAGPRARPRCSLQRAAGAPSS